MSNELQLYSDPAAYTGDTVIVKLFQAGVQIGANISTSEVGSTGVFIGDMPSGSAGDYVVIFYDSAIKIIGQGEISWDGSKEIYLLAPEVGDIADAVWDEILTGATHNIATSAGRRLREASDVMVLREEETAQGGSLTTITLNASASSIDGFYDMSTLLIISGAGAGQARTFDQYNGTTKVGVACDPWSVAPDNTSKYIIRGHACTAVYKMHDNVYTEIWNYIKKLIPFTI